MKNLISVILYLLITGNVFSQDTLFLDFTYQNAKNPYRSYRKNIDTAKFIMVDYYYCLDKYMGLYLMFLHTDSSKIRKVDYNELEKIKITTLKQLSFTLNKVSERERLEEDREFLEEEKKRKKRQESRSSNLPNTTT